MQQGKKNRLFLLGFMGSGKTHVGKKLSKRLGIPFLDLDDYIESTHGQSINEIFVAKGETGFRLLERAALHYTGTLDSVIIGCGGGTPCFFDNMEWMNRHGKTCYLNYPVTILFNRLKTRKAKRPLLKEMDDDRLLGFIKEKLEERNEYYLQAKYHYVPNQKKTEAVDVIEKLIEW